MNKHTPDVPVLLAEDDENDVLLMERAFEEAQLSNPLVVARNGQEAIFYLDPQESCSNRSWPGLLLLDLKMPVKDGWDVLKWLQEPSHRKGLRVIVLSSSNNESDVERALTMGANAYRVKPFDFQGLVQLARELRDSWLLSERTSANVKRLAA